MRKLNTYYVVDTISETIVGSFQAISIDMAKKVLEETFNKNDQFNSIRDVLGVYKATPLFEVCETYSEVLSSCVPVKTGHSWIVDAPNEDDNEYA